jgi:isopenicillin-N N-acyltransferase-like protein
MAIPHLKVSGDAHQRGRAQGEILRTRIHETVDFYESHIFGSANLSKTVIKEKAAAVRRLIGSFGNEYIDEIDAIAEASDVENWRLYALNARTEILNSPIGECTSAVFKGSAVMGQTWDWIRQLEDLVVLVEHHYPNGLKLITLTEPGMLAKLGFNSKGLGLCLNFLASRHHLDGLPVHIVCRAILESHDIGQARNRILESGQGKSSHFLVADSAGDALSIEFAGGKETEIKLQCDDYVHTNHCINNRFPSDSIPGSEDRLAQANERLKQHSADSLEKMKQLLLHNGGEEYPIHAEYKPEELFGGLEVGTCATLIFDLKMKAMHIKKGPDLDTEFATIKLA